MADRLNNNVRMINVTHPQMQRFHEPAPRHGDLTGAIRAKQLAEKRTADEAAERDRRAAQEAADAAGAAELADMDRVIDYTEVRRDWDERDGIVS